MVTKSEHPPLVLKGCNHCGGTLEYGFDEYGQYYTCMTCGRMTDLPSPFMKRDTTDPTKGLLFLSYIGPSPQMKGIEVPLRIKPGRTKDSKLFFCPLPLDLKACGRDMVSCKAGAGIYRVKRTEGLSQMINVLAYRCPLKHEIRVVDGVGWF